jgi:hypothetical protein
MFMIYTINSIDNKFSYASHFLDSVRDTFVNSLLKDANKKDTAMDDYWAILEKLNNENDFNSTLKKYGFEELNEKKSKGCNYDTNYVISEVADINIKDKTLLIRAVFDFGGIDSTSISFNEFKDYVREKGFDGLENNEALSFLDEEDYAFIKNLSNDANMEHRLYKINPKDSLLINLDTTNKIALLKSKNDFIVSDISGEFYKNMTYSNFQSAIANYQKLESEIVENKLSTADILKRDIQNIKEHISFIETSLEKLDRTIETFSNNLFGANGYLDEYKALLEEKSLIDIGYGNEKELETINKSLEYFETTIKNQLGLDIKDIDDSSILIDKSNEVKKSFNEDLKQIKIHLGKTTKKLDSVLEKNEQSLFTTEDLFDAKHSQEDFADAMNELSVKKNAEQKLN